MVNGGEREGDGGDGDGTRRTQVREEPAAHDRTPCVHPGGRQRAACEKRSGEGWPQDEGHSARTAGARKTEKDEEGTTETR